jgi:CheY-like chemotaxis protein
MRAESFIPLPQPHQTDRRPVLISPAPIPPQQEILVLEGGSIGAKHAVALRRDYHVVMMTELAVAKQYLSKTALALVIADIDSQRDGIDICHAAKSLRTPATVLMTASEATSVPDVLAAGCDGILLKPFADNLLYARIGRLLRTRGEQLQARARLGNGASDVSHRPEPPLATTNRAWPDTACPSCDHGGAVSFEFASHRRSWYACPACKTVWLGKRQE